MKKVFAVAMLPVFLLVFVCVGQVFDAPCYNGKHNPYEGLQPTDLAKKYLDSRLQDQKDLNRKNDLSGSLSYDYSSIWLLENNPKSNTFKDIPQDGVIGTNYQRIEMYIGKATKSQFNPDTYLITGKSKVNKNVCNFSGEIRLIKLFYKKCGEEYEEYLPDPSDHTRHPKSAKCAVLFAEYVFYEDSAQSHTGVFKGVMECDVYTDKTKMLLDEIGLDFPGGYSNRTFVGTWTDYKTKKPKHCIWGDGGRLPYAGHMRWGDGDYVMCPEYLKYGWQKFDYNSEGYEKEMEYERKNKWWLKK